MPFDLLTSPRVQNGRMGEALQTLTLLRAKIPWAMLRLATLGGKGKQEVTSSFVQGRTGESVNQQLFAWSQLISSVTSGLYFSWEISGWWASLPQGSFGGQGWGKIHGWLPGSLLTRWLHHHPSESSFMPESALEFLIIIADYTQLAKSLELWVSAANTFWKCCSLPVYLTSSPPLFLSLSRSLALSLSASQKMSMKHFSGPLALLLPSVMEGSLHWVTAWA